MTMEYKIGSLAALISGNKSVSDYSKNSKFSEIGSSEKGVVKFETVSAKKNKKPKWEVEDIDNESSVDANHKTSSDETSHMLKRIKKTKLAYSNENESETKPSKATRAEKRLKNKRKKEMQATNEYKKEREIFVGNVPNDITKKKLKNLFEKFGKVENVRLRGAPLADPRVPKKVAIIKRKFHPDRNSMHAYVRFLNEDSAKQAVKVNGMSFENHHLRVDLVTEESRHDIDKAIFVGNVPFAAEEDQLWKIFESCGTISSIRIVRDQLTGVGKGFAYVNFEKADAVELALKLDGTELNKRTLRIQRCMKKMSKNKEKRLRSEKYKKQKEMRLQTEKKVSDEEINTDDEEVEKSPEVKLKNKEKSRKHKKRKVTVSENAESIDLDEGVDSDGAEIKKVKIFEEDQSFASKKTDKKPKMRDHSEDNEKKLLENVDYEKPLKTFSFKASFQGQKTAEVTKLRKKKKGKTNQEELEKMSLIRKISSKSKPSMKKVKKSALKIKSAVKKMKLKTLKK